MKFANRRISLGLIALLLLLVIPVVVSAQGAYLGIRTVTNDRGTQIVEVIPGSPAAAAGFAVDDLILGVNQKALTQDFTLDAALAVLKPADKVQFTVSRGGTTLQIVAVMGTLPTLIPTAGIPTAATTLSPQNTAVPTAIPIPTYMGVGLEEQPTGLLVVGILQGSPADLAGLRVGDVLLSFDNQTLSTVSQAQGLIQTKSPGTLMTVHAQRGDKTLDFTVTLALHPSTIIGTPLMILTPGTAVSAVPEPTVIPTNTPALQNDTYQTPTGSHVTLGVSYESVTPAWVTKNHLSVDYGALVIEVVPNSPADVAGIKPGDVITEVEGDKVDAKRTLAIRMIPYIEGDTITLTVVRGTEKLSLTVTLVNRGSA